MAKKVEVTQDPETVMTTEVLATAIQAISEGVRRMRAGRLTDEALVLLVTHAAPSIGGKYQKSYVTAKQVRAVLEGIESLETTYLKPIKAKK